MAFAHAPVLLDEVLAVFSERLPRRFVDATVGGGGHAESLLAMGVGSERYVALDRDPEAVAAARHRLAGFGDRVLVVHRPFSDVRAVLAELDWPSLDGLLADLGVSSHQLDSPGRGFGLRVDGALDMRMDPTRGESAAELVRRLDADALASLLRELGEVPGAYRIAVAMKRESDAGRLETTSALARTVDASAPAALKRRSLHPATLVFQALRCAVNDEMGELDSLLAAVPDVLAPGGRAAIIAFQSLEDRRVKQAFRRLTRPAETLPGVPLVGEQRAPFRDVTRKGEVASERERQLNPRARSARLRAIERVE